MGLVRPLSLIIGPSEVIVLYWAMLPGFFCIGCILGRAPYTKETLSDFFLNHGSRKRGQVGVVSSYPTSTNLPRVDELSTDPRVSGRHSLVLEPRCMNTYGSMGIGLGHVVIV